VVTTFQTGVDPAGEFQQIISGSVRLDATADERSALDLIVMGDWPVNNQLSLLAPFGQELFVERGIEGVSITGTEYVPLGYFRIETVEQDDAPRSPIRITGRDRMAALIEARMLEPRTFAVGTTFQAIFENLVWEVYPDAVLNIDATVATSTLREKSTVEEDRFTFLADMATARGCVMYFDYQGFLTVNPPPDSTTPVWTVDAGPAGVLVSARRQLSRTGVYNAVVAAGTEAVVATAVPPPRAVVLDEDPESATYWYGPFGKVPRFYASPLLFTDAQCTTAAGSILARVTGLPYSLDLTAIPNPALEPLDPVGVVLGGETPGGGTLTSDVALLLPGTVGSYFETPDAASLDITGDIDMRALISPDDWSPPVQGTIVSKSTAAGEYSYRMALLTNGRLELGWSSTGINLFTASSSVATGFINGSAHWVRVTRVVGGVISFYTSEDGNVWNPLGTTSAAGATTMFSGTGLLRAGASLYYGATEMFDGFIWRIEIRNGVNGPLVAAPYFDDQVIGTIAFTDSTGKVWTKAGSAEIALTGTQSYRPQLGVHVIDALTIPLSSDEPMTANVRSTVEYSITG
jgi:hypothetical protein